MSPVKDEMRIDVYCPKCQEPHSLVLPNVNTWAEWIGEEEVRYQKDWDLTTEVDDAVSVNVHHRVRLTCLKCGFVAQADL